MMKDNQNKTDEQDLIELNIKIGEAELKRNAIFLAGILADDLKFRRANGTIVDKTAYLTGVQDPANIFDYLYSEDVQVSVYETTAVVALRVRAKGMRSGTPFEGTFRNLRVFLRQPAWQCTMWFNVRIEDEKA
jgi:hypothetical protein